MQAPDRVRARDRAAELERRIGLDPLDELLARRTELVAKVADLRARHGAFGTYNDLRKIQLARIGQLIRAEAQRDGVKLTEAAVDEMAHADPRYVEHVIQATQERAQWSLLEDAIQAINDRIMRDQAVARFATAEMYL